MAITEADIKLFASQRLTDEADGGGRATSLVVQDGVKNNLFPDLGSVARAVGALHLRKAFMHVTSNNADTLFDSHMILDDLPDDPATSALILPAAGAADSRADIVAAVSAQGSGFPFKGTVALAAAAASGARSVLVADTRVPFIPLSKTSTPQTNVPAQYVKTTAREAVGAATAYEFSFFTASGNHVLRMSPPTHVVMNVGTSTRVESISGTCLVNGQAGVITFDGTNVVLTGNGQTYVGVRVPNISNEIYDFTLNPTTQAVAVASPAATFQPLALFSRPRQSVRHAITAQNQSFTYTLNIPSGSVPGTETVQASFASPAGTWSWRTRGTGLSFHSISGADASEGDWEFRASANGGPTLSFSSINRVTGEVTLTFNALPAVGSEIVIFYVAGGTAQNLALASVSNGGTFAANTVTATLPVGHEIVALTFKFAGDPTIITLANLQNGSAGGAVNVTSGVITMPARNGQTIERWLALTSPININVSSATVTLAAGLDLAGVDLDGTTAANAAFTAASDSLGRFSTALVSGFYSQFSGRASLQFSAPVRVNTLVWSGEQSTYSPSGFDLGGLNAAVLPSDGRVTVVRVGDLAVVHDTQAGAPQNVAAAQVVNLGRTNLSRVRIIGSTGVVHAVMKAGAQINGGATADLVAGTVTINNPASYVQPVVIEHRIEALTAVSTVNADGTVGLSSPLPRAFPITSKLSTALSLGDLGARVGQPFAQNTWTGVWQDTVIGAPPAADFAHAAFPITVTNPGAVTDRWAIIFTTNTSFRIVGENTGEIFGAWGTAGNVAPINPVTNTPFFTIPSTGWGGGWAQGNVLRFNTVGALSPAWIARCTQPSNPFDGLDSLTVSMRGEANA